MAKLTAEDRQRIQASLADQAKQETLKQRAREAYEAALNEAIYALTIASREAHFHPKGKAKPAPLSKPDDLRACAIKALAEKGIHDPDAKPATPQVKKTEATTNPQ